MCTAMTLQSMEGKNFFARTMDFSYEIDPTLYVFPRNYTWNNVLGTHTIRNRYQFMAVGQQADGLIAFFDGVNETGFAAAALYFAGYAQYNMYLQHAGKERIPSLDALHYMLGNCGSVRELVELLPNVTIVGFEDPVTQTAAPLHWIATDRTGECVVIEQTAAGLRAFQNEIGVMANSPDFLWHMTNLRNYVGVSPRQEEETKWGDVVLRPFGQGAGTTGLPGGYTSPERFVRTSFLKTHTVTPKDDMDAVTACFHIMESVSISKGAVVTNRDTFDYTQYVILINTDTCEYFFKTYDNLQISVAGPLEECHFTTPVSLGSIGGSPSYEKR